MKVLGMKMVAAFPAFSTEDHEHELIMAHLPKGAVGACPVFENADDALAAGYGEIRYVETVDTTQEAKR